MNLTVGKSKSNEDAKLIERVTKIAAQTVIEHLDKEKRPKRDHRLRNIKLLLRNYRNFVAHSEEVQEELTALQKAKELDTLYEEEFTIESIMRSKQRTLVLVQLMQRMLEVYQIMCEKSGDPAEERRYKIIYEMYISDDKKTADEIARGHFIDRRTVFKDINKSCETLSVLMFGVDGIRLE